MFFSKHAKHFKEAEQETLALLQQENIKPKAFSASSISGFFKELSDVMRLIGEEKEILVFAALQWLCIAVGYFVWVQILDWIPDSVWHAIAEASENEQDVAFTLLNIVLLAWSFFIVVLVSYPISLLSASMVAAHYLRHSGQISTLPKCLGIARNNITRLWIFTAVDAWITVNAIFDRLPRKNHKRTALDELLYYAWKIGTMGILPALTAGKGVIDATKYSFLLIKNAPVSMVSLRMGYSFFCWIVGILTYIAAIFYVFGEHTLLPEDANFVFKAYFYAGVPIIMAVGVISLFLRPLYLLMVAKKYTDFNPIPAEALQARRGLDATWYIFVILSSLLCCAAFFPESFGIQEWFDKIAEQELQEFYTSQPEQIR